MPAAVLAIVAAATAGSTIVGCAVAPPKGSPVLDGFRPDGGGGPDEATVASLPDAPGVILRFEPGDVIEVTIGLEGDVATGEMSVPVTVRRSLMIHAGTDGTIGSLDEGVTWKPLLQLLAGSLETGMSISASDRKNRAEVRLDARIR